MSPAYHPVETRSTGVKLKGHLLKLGVVRTKPAHPIQPRSATPAATSAQPWYGRALCVTDVNRPSAVSHASGLVQPKTWRRLATSTAIVHGVSKLRAARPTIMMSRGDRPES